MKHRLGFVSNSSSSSFVVIADNLHNKSDLQENETEIVLGECGETEFGWEFKTHYDFESKLNFAFLQTTYSEEHGGRWYNMIEAVLLSAGIKIVGNSINDSYSGPGFFGYIDHQSSAIEDRNTEIFESEDVLKRFLFSKDSYIEQGNDNV